MIRLGTQGWNYPDWVGPLYPSGTRPPDFLAVYARAFHTVEIDSTFYAIPPSHTVRSWADRVPPGFVFAAKLPRSITHERWLRASREELDLFSDRIRELGDRLGPLLIQLPPDFAPAERPALRDFLAILPRDLRFAVEFRQAGWATAETLSLLADNDVAFALSDGRWLPRSLALELAEQPTTGWSYLRWMGPNRDLTEFGRVQIDRTDELAAWSGPLARLHAQGIALYGYVNNHFAGHSPATVRHLLRTLDQPVTEPDQISEQISLL